MKTTIKFMALGFGPAGNSFSWSLFSIISLSLTFATSILLIKALFKFKEAEFRRCLAMFLFLLGSIVFALAIGWGRAPSVPFFGMPIRYVMLALPALMVCYFSWFLYGSQTLKQPILHPLSRSRTQDVPLLQKPVLHTFHYYNVL